MLDALIFDVDGTLAETEELHRRAFNDTFADWGLDWHWSGDDYRRLLQTTGGKERIARHMQDTGIDPGSIDIPALHRAKTACYANLMAAGGLALRDGIPDLLEQARQAGIALAIATTTSRPNVEALCLATLGQPANEVFSVIASGDEVAAKKPAPDVYRLALDRLGHAPDTVVALEDSANGLMSARAAGLTCIVSPSAYTRTDAFDGALCVVDAFPDLGGLDGIKRRMPD